MIFIFTRFYQLNKLVRSLWSVHGTDDSHDDIIECLDERQKMCDRLETAWHPNPSRKQLDTPTLRG